MLYLLIYLLVGIVAIMLAAYLHVLKALKRGYTLDLIKEVLDEIELKYDSWIGLIVGLIIWPIRLIQFRDTKKYLMFLYTLKSVIKQREGETN